MLDFSFYGVGNSIDDYRMDREEGGRLLGMFIQKAGKALVNCRTSDVIGGKELPAFHWDPLKPKGEKACHPHYHLA